MSRDNWTTEQHDEYSRLMAIADTVARGYCSRPKPTGETIGGLRLSEDVTEMAQEIMTREWPQCEKRKDIYETAQAIFVADVHRGNNDPHWVRARNHCLAFLQAHDLDTEKKICDWLSKVY
jgi:hypothetical protein